MILLLWFLSNNFLFIREATKAVSRVIIRRRSFSLLWHWIMWLLSPEAWINKNVIKYDKPLLTDFYLLKFWEKLSVKLNQFAWVHVVVWKVKKQTILVRSCIFCFVFFLLFGAQTYSRRSQHVIKFVWLIISEFTFWFFLEALEMFMSKKKRKGDKWAYEQQQRTTKNYNHETTFQLAQFHFTSHGVRIPLTEWHLTYGQRMTISRISFARKKFLPKICIKRIIYGDTARETQFNQIKMPCWGPLKSDMEEKQHSFADVIDTIHLLAALKMF